MLISLNNTRGQRDRSSHRVYFIYFLVGKKYGFSLCSAFHLAFNEKNRGSDLPRDRNVAVENFQGRIVAINRVRLIAGINFGPFGHR